MSSPRARREEAPQIVIPQGRASLTPGREALQVTGVKLAITVTEDWATSCMDILVSNGSGRTLEAELWAPVPSGTQVRSLHAPGAEENPRAQLLDRAGAQRACEAVAASTLDPVLLEFAGYGLIRSTAFPVPARGSRQLQLIFEQALPSEGDRFDYELPRSEALQYRIPWEISAQVKGRRPIAAVYSPSHAVQVERLDERQVTLRLGPPSLAPGIRQEPSASGSQQAAKKRPQEAQAEPQPQGRTARPPPQSGAETAAAAQGSRSTSGAGIVQPGSFRFSYLYGRPDGPNATLYAYADGSSDGGYFLFLAGLPEVQAPSVKGQEAGQALRRELTLVLDRSGSMAGERMAELKGVSRRMLDRLGPGEYFNLLTFNETIERLAPEPVEKTAQTQRSAQEFLDRIQPRGGSDFHAVLSEALRPAPAPGCLPLVLFVTDGMPTAGRTGEQEIRALASEANRHHRRIHTLGLGTDLNATLLDQLAEDSRATSSYVLPGERLEASLAGLFRRLEAPLLADPRLQAVDAQTQPDPGRLAGLLPLTPPDLFLDTPLLLAGQYRGTAPLRLRLSGTYRGRPCDFTFVFDVSKAGTRNGFVPRLWASRRIGLLVDRIRRLGAHLDPTAAQPDLEIEPRLKELSEEVLRLSREFGILTEYTAFLGREEALRRPWAQLLVEAGDNFLSRGVRQRAGQAAVVQSLNRCNIASQQSLNPSNELLDDQLRFTNSSSVQQVHDRTFYRSKDGWVDSRTFTADGASNATRTLRPGTPAFQELKERLIREGRAGILALGQEVILFDEATRSGTRLLWRPEEQPAAAKAEASY